MEIKINEILDNLNSTSKIKLLNYSKKENAKNVLKLKDFKFMVRSKVNSPVSLYCDYLQIRRFIQGINREYYFALLDYNNFQNYKLEVLDLYDDTLYMRIFVNIDFFLKTKNKNELKKILYLLKYNLLLYFSIEESK